MLISIDHGNKQVKTTHPLCRPFTSGLRESVTPPFGGDVIQYGGKYYALVDERIPYRRDKTEDDRFFVLTLFAIAKEVEARGAYTPSTVPVQLAVGLPPAHYGAQYQRFENYFLGRGEVRFSFNRKPFSIEITKALCFPQAYAAAVTMFQSLGSAPKVLVVDIGGFTADFLYIKQGKAQLGACDSLENGVIVLYNRIRSRVNADFDTLLEESDIDAILNGQENSAPEIVKLVEAETASFVSDLFSALRERMIDLRSGQVVFLGGGSILLRRHIEQSGKVGRPLFIEDIRANAKGYELLYSVSASRG